MRLKKFKLVEKHYLAFAIVLLALNNTSFGQEEAKIPPNIIYIMSDDHAAHAISAYGGLYKDVAPTPNIDKLANEGALFTNTFCTNAICGPSRAAILTGNYSNKNGFYKNDDKGNNKHIKCNLNFEKLKRTQKELNIKI